jgi:3-dehydroquinate synthase
MTTWGGYMRKITVKLCNRSYQIFIQYGLLDAVSEQISHILGKPRIMVITDYNVGTLYADKLTKNLTDSGFDVFLAQVPAGERSKSIDTAENLYSFALEHNMDRTSVILALGGGAIGDLAGFVAATYMRGIGFIQVPTSLLAQVDSSVGGKVAVNLNRVKNIIGAFYQPQMVLIDPKVLKTIPDRAYREGMAEVIKCGIVYDEDFFCWLEQKDLGRLSKEDIIHVIQRSCQIKSEIVSCDETENGLRAVLNFGHTVGHALESLLGQGVLLHGEAVALGMIIETKIALNRGLIDRETHDRILTLIKSITPVTIHRGIDVESLIYLMKFDKKNTAGNITFILPQKIGTVKKYNDITREEITNALKEMNSANL